MPKSQFGDSPSSLSATLDELVALARHLRTTPADVPSRITRLEGLSQMLGYFCMSHWMTNAGEPSLCVGDVRCSWHDCARTWRDFDACLLNFAPRGEPPIWLCRDHHPSLTDGGIRPAGWQPDDVTRESVLSSRKAALARLSRDELRVVNPRVGG